MSVGHAARSVLALNLGSASLKAASYALPASADAHRPVGRETGRISVETAHPASTAPGENSVPPAGAFSGCRQRTWLLVRR